MGILGGGIGIDCGIDCGIVCIGIFCGSSWAIGICVLIEGGMEYPPGGILCIGGIVIDCGIVIGGPIEGGMEYPPGGPWKLGVIAPDSMCPAILLFLMLL